MNVDVEFVFGKRFAICGFFIYPVNSADCSHALYPAADVDVYIGDPPVQALLRDSWKFPTDISIMPNGLDEFNPECELRVRCQVTLAPTCNLFDCLVWLAALGFRCEKAPTMFYEMFTSHFHALRHMHPDVFAEMFSQKA